MEEVNIIASVRELNRAVPWPVQSLQRVESAQARVAVVTRHHVILSCGLSFIISSSRFVSRRPTPTLIMAPRGSAKEKQAQKPAEAEAKTIWYLLVDHQRQLRFGELTDLDVQADITVAALKRMIKEENPTELGPFKANKFEVWNTNTRISP